MTDIPDSFIEPGSGLRMERDKFYILSDSGSFYASIGYDSVADALADWTDNMAAGFESTEIRVPAYDRDGAGWPDLDAVNVMAANDLYHFWITDDKELFDDANKPKPNGPAVPGAASD